jgi:hypothetical protein
MTQNRMNAQHKTDGTIMSGAISSDFDEPVVSHWLLLALGSIIVLLILLPACCGLRASKQKED